MFPRSVLTVLLFAVMASFTLAFTPANKKPSNVMKNVMVNDLTKSINNKVIAASAFVIVNTPSVIVNAVEDVVDDYEYGKVDAPIGIAVAGGLLAILTALLPLALRGGEEAFEEIRERDADTFGKKNKDVLRKK